MKEKIKNVIKNELTGWKPLEVAWLAIATAVIIGLSIYWGDTLMGIISAATGVICVVCTGKGKLSAYAFGLVNCVLYAIISYQARLFGESMLQLYYIPMQFVGFFVWFRHMNDETHEVEKRHMSWLWRIVTAAGIGLATWLYGFLLTYLGDAMPYVDAFTTVSSVVAMIVSVWMFSEQWWIWVAVDIFSVYMWWCNFAANQDSIATLVMWLVYLGNAIIMLIKWEKEACKNKKKEKSDEI